MAIGETSADLVTTSDLTGGIIPNGSSVQQALQSIEAAIESDRTVNMGTYLRISSLTDIPMTLFGLAENRTAAQNKISFQEAFSQLASSSTGGRLMIPPGTFNINGDLTFTAPGKTIEIFGVKGASYFRVLNGSRLFYIDVDGGMVRLDGLSMNAVDIASGFEAMIFVQAYGFGGFTARDLNIQRDGTMPGFIGIDMGRVRASDIENCEIQTGQDIDYASDGVGIRAFPQEGEGTIHNLTKLFVRNTGIGASFIMGSNSSGVGNLEGITIDKSAFVGVTQGIIMDGSVSNYEPPHVNILNNHINAVQYGILINRVAQVNILSNSLYIDNSQTPIAAISATAMRKSRIAHNEISAIRQMGSSPAALGDFTGIALGSGSRDVSLIENRYTGTGNSPMIWIQNGADRIPCFANRYDRAAGTGTSVVILDQGPSGLIDLGGNMAY